MSVLDRLNRPKRAPRRPKNKQHAARGASFLKFADKLRDSAAAATDPTKADWLHTVADAAAATGKETRKLR